MKLECVAGWWRRHTTQPINNKHNSTTIPAANHTYRCGGFGGGGGEGRKGEKEETRGGRTRWLVASAINSGRQVDINKLDGFLFFWRPPYRQLSRVNGRPPVGQSTSQQYQDYSDLRVMLRSRVIPLNLPSEGLHSCGL